MRPPLSISVSSTTDSAIFLQKAVSLAKKLQIPFVGQDQEWCTDIVLAYTLQGLKLLQPIPGKKNTRCLLFIDFVNGKNGYRLARNCTVKQPLARAAGLKHGFRPDILDGTGGLGGDAFVLASLGCSVTMCERSPVLAALLEDGLLRASQDTKTANIIEQRLRLETIDARQYLQTCSKVYNTVYLDPMYPHSKESALNSQSMRIIRELVGDDQDSGQLLEIALAGVGNRVVVKRPLAAPGLIDLPPSHNIFMKNSRFDIYLVFKEQQPVYL